MSKTSKRVLVELPAVVYLNKRFRYEDGELYWKFIDVNDTSIYSSVGSRKRFNTANGGDKVGTYSTRPDGSKVVQVVLDNKSYLLHRVIYKMHTEEDAEIIDHLDGNPENNCITNLVSGSDRDNSMNVKKRVDNSSGTTGVSWHGAANKWYAYISYGGKRVSLGFYENLGDAIRVRKEKECLYGYSPRHGTDKGE